MNYTQARENMVDSQLRTNKVTRASIISAFRALPRETFVKDNQKPRAYVDEDLPIGFVQNRYLMEPMVMARLIQSADLSADDFVLDIGCLTGYSTALLSKICSSVIGVEEDAKLVRHARQALEAMACYNTSIVKGALNRGHKKQAPYNVIFLFGSVSQVPQNILDQLADGGRLLTVIDEPSFEPNSSSGKATLFLKSEATISHKELFDANVKPLPGFEQSKGFVF